MRKTITFLCLLIGLTAFSQSSLNDLQNLDHDLRLGCCGTDTDNHPDFPNCIIPDYQEYYVNGDANINDNHLRISNAKLEVFGNFYAIEGNVTFSDNCNSLLIVEGDLIYMESVIDIASDRLIVKGNIINATLSLPYFEFIKNPKILGLPYEVIDITGRIVQTGNVTIATVKIRSTDQLYFLRVKGYESKKIPF